jgi:hypothetical protein
MNSPQITYAPRPDASPETEAAVLAHVYKFVLDCRAKKEATLVSRPDSGSNSEREKPRGGE